MIFYAVYWLYTLLLLKHFGNYLNVCWDVSLMVSDMKTETIVLDGLMIISDSTTTSLIV
jgi:hypothetical protein